MNPFPGLWVEDNIASQQAYVRCLGPCNNHPSLSSHKHQRFAWLTVLEDLVHGCWPRCFASVDEDEAGAHSGTKLSSSVQTQTGRGKGPTVPLRACAPGPKTSHLLEVLLTPNGTGEVCSCLQGSLNMQTTASLWEIRHPVTPCTGTRFQNMTWRMNSSHIQTSALASSDELECSLGGTFGSGKLMRVTLGSRKY